MDIEVIRLADVPAALYFGTLALPPRVTTARASVTRRELEITHSRALLAEALRAEHGITEYTLAKDERGKPYITDTYDTPAGFGISLSHTASDTALYVAVLCGTGAGVAGVAGVDVQYLRSASLTRAARKYCTPWELSAYGGAAYGGDACELLRVFTVKEAYSKLTGEGLGMGFCRTAADTLPCWYARRGEVGVAACYAVK